MSNVKTTKTASPKANAVTSTSKPAVTNVNALYEATIEKYLDMGYKYKGTPSDNAATLKHTRKGGATIAIFVYECLVTLSSIPIYDMLAMDSGTTFNLLISPVFVFITVTTILTHIYNNKVDIRITKTNSVQVTGFSEKKMKTATKRKNVIRAIVTTLCAVLLVYLAVTRL